MKEYKFSSADAALAFFKNNDCSARNVTNVIPTNPEKNYPTWSCSDTSRPFAHLYTDELIFCDTEEISGKPLAIFKKYQARLKRALKKEKIPVIA